MKYQQHHDTLNKFHFLKHPKKCQLKHITFDTNLNSLITNPKLLTPLYYTHLNLIGQKPKIKVAKNSIASFKLRPNMPVGTHTTIQSKSYLFDSLLKNLKFAFLPGIIRNTEKLKPILTV
jgi:ribosomal protein L5